MGGWQLRTLSRLEEEALDCVKRTEAERENSSSLAKEQLMGTLRKPRIWSINIFGGGSKSSVISLMPLACFTG